MNKALFLLLILAGSPVLAVPVVPNFSAGSVTSNTTTTQNTTETIRSYSYNTGYTYTIGGTNIQPSSGTAISPSIQAGTAQTTNGVTSTWSGINFTNRPTFSQTTAGAATNYSESYMGPGLANVTDITRTIQLESVTNSTSTFTQ